MLGADDSLKLGAVIKAHRTYLKLLGTDAANQLAQLVAFEHYVGVTAPNRVKEVAALFISTHSFPVQGIPRSSDTRSQCFPAAHHKGVLF